MSLAASRPAARYTYEPGRLALGLLLAPTVPSAFFVVWTGTEGFQGFLLMCLLGLTAVAIPFTPLMAWRLPRTRRPFLTSISLGAISAPGPLGYVLAFVSPFTKDPGALLAAMVLTTAPLGALGGLIFYLSAVRHYPPSINLNRQI